MSQYANEICANCGKSLFQCARGESNLYNPGAPIYLLCDPCWFGEQDLIDLNGTNEQPSVLQHYEEVLRNAD